MANFPQLFIFSILVILPICAAHDHRQLLPLKKFNHVKSSQNFRSIHKNDILGPEAQTLLPKAVTPEHYTLSIRPILNDPDEDSFTAPGSLQIVIYCHEVTSQVTVHKDPSLQVDEDSMSLFQLSEDGSHGDQIGVVGTAYDQPNVFYTIHLATTLQPERRYELSLNFVAQVNRGRSGLYRAQYQTPEGEIRYMATTQFQSFGARLAFPCFDEPGLKATFDITVGRRRELNSMSNTLPKEIGMEDPSLPAGWVWDVYNRTMPMSSYLVAIIVSDFVCETANPAIFDGRPVRVCGAAHQIVGHKGGVYPSEAAARSMKFLEETFKYPYEMYKLDNAAIPLQYFAPGAMENWGMVTYGDTRIMYYQDETEENRYAILSIIGHELAHQWFGNLITFATWGNVWLSEGFATYISYMVVNSLAPEFVTKNQFLFEEMQVALEFDVDVDDTVYNEAFDSSQYIIYNKAASLVRMMEGFLGKDLLLDALVEYLRRFAYQPVTQDQLFGVLTEFAGTKIPEGATIKRIMDTWTLQPGYPLLRVVQFDESHVYISQEKFLPATSSPTDILWEVPVAVATANNPDFTNHTPALWLVNNSSGILFEHEATNWIVLNPDAMSFYRVHYDDDLLALIHGQMADNLDTLSGLSRSQIIDDYFNFAYLGHEPIEKAMELTKYLENEDDPIVWDTVTYHFAESGMEDLPEFGDYLLPKVEAVLNRLLLNWTLPLTEIGEGSQLIFAKKLVDLACRLKSRNCKTMAASLTNQWMEEPQNLNEIIPPDMEVTILCHGVASLGQVAYDFLKDEYAKADPYGVHKGRFMRAMICSQSANDLERFLLESVSKLKNLNQDTTTIESSWMAKGEIFDVFLEALQKPEGGGPIVMKILGREVKSLRDSFGDTKLTQIVTSLSHHLDTPLELVEFEKLVQEFKSELPGEREILKKALNNVESNVDWMGKTETDLRKWLKTNKRVNII